MGGWWRGAGHTDRMPQGFLLACSPHWASSKPFITWHPVSYSLHSDRDSFTPVPGLWESLPCVISHQESQVHGGIPFHWPAGIRNGVKGIALAYQMELCISLETVLHSSSSIFQVELVLWAWKWWDMGGHGCRTHSVPLLQWMVAQLWESTTFTAGSKQVSSLSRHSLISQHTAPINGLGRESPGPCFLGLPRKMDNSMTHKTSRGVSCKKNTNLK